MLWTNQSRRRASICRTHAAAAMPTGVVEGTDFTVTAAHDNDRVVANLDREETARLADFAVMADEQPVAIPDQFHVQLVEIGSM